MTTATMPVQDMESWLDVTAQGPPLCDAGHHDNAIRTNMVLADAPCPRDATWQLVVNCGCYRRLCDEHKNRLMKMIEDETVDIYCSVCGGRLKDIHFRPLR